MRKIYIIIALIYVTFATPAIADMTSTFTLPSGVDVKIVEAPFEKKLFRIDGCSERNSGCRINGHVPFGIVFGLPKTYVKSIAVSFQGRAYSLDVSICITVGGLIHSNIKA